MLLAMMIAMNPWLANPVAPWAILDHQMAGTAVRVNAIQNSWAAAGQLNLARISMAIDLIFIAVYSWGAYCGGRMMRARGTPTLRRLGTIIIVAACADCLLDYTETICQFIQVMTFKGSDNLAGIAATVRPFKSASFLTTFVGLLVALWIRRTTRQTA
jgi:hypothetical protein